MIDINHDKLISLAKASHFPCFIRDGRAPSSVTLWRWARRGVRGIKLETVAVGAVLYTTRASAAKFIADLSERETGNRPVTSEIAINRLRANAVLESAGI